MRKTSQSRTAMSLDARSKYIRQKLSEEIARAAVWVRLTITSRSPHFDEQKGCIESESIVVENMGKLITPLSTHLPVSTLCSPPTLICRQPLQQSPRNVGLELKCL
jgi:hypothetical protein